MPSLARNPSKHKRNSSSQSLLGHRPSANHEEAYTEANSLWLFQAAVFVKLFATLSSKSPVPSEYVQPAIQSLLFILGSLATPLSAIGTDTNGDKHSTSVADPLFIDADPVRLERDTWTLVSALLSGSYGTTTAHEIKLTILAPVLERPLEGVPIADMRRSRGAARALRLALRQGTQHRLALSRNEDIDDSSPYSPVFSSDSGLRHPLETRTRRETIR